MTNLIKRWFARRATNEWRPGEHRRRTCRLRNRVNRSRVELLESRLLLAVTHNGCEGGTAADLEVFADADGDSVVVNTVVLQDPVFPTPIESLAVNDMPVLRGDGSYCTANQVQTVRVAGDGDPDANQFTTRLDERFRVTMVGGGGDDLLSNEPDFSEVAAAGRFGGGDGFDRFQRVSTRQGVSVTHTGPGEGIVSVEDILTILDEYAEMEDLSIIPASADYGDAPASRLPDDAHHFIEGLVALGMEVDSDAAAQPNPAATGDDFDGNDDEDGVEFKGPLEPGRTVQALVRTSAAGRLDVFASYVAGSVVKLLDNQFVLGGPNNVVEITAPTGPTDDVIYVRFRYSTAGGLPAGGSAFDGEVEDYALGSIKGFKFDDANGDGVPQADEPRLAGWTIFLDTNTNGMFDPDDYQTTTDAAGNYRFTGLPPGEYQVREVAQPGWRQTTPPQSPIALEEGQVVDGVFFGNRREPAGADLSVTKVASRNPAIDGQPITYTITVTNNGPSDATGVFVSDAFSSPVLFVSKTTTNGTCTCELEMA